MSAWADPGPFADSTEFDRVRAAIGTDFVPTVYRRLALYPRAFSVALPILGPIAEIARELDFTGAAQRTACIDDEADTGTLSATDVPAEVAEIIARYRAANPVNLLFSMCVAGVNALPGPNTRVMGPPLPAPTDDLLADVLAAHGGVITPGLWRELAAWPAAAVPLWQRMRSKVEGNRIVDARQRVQRLARSTLANTGFADLARQIAPHLPSEGLAELRWFPTGVSTMVVEGEWLHRWIVLEASTPGPQLLH